MGSLMLTKCQSNSEAIGEILDLFRFIVDKYSCMTLAMPELAADGQQPQAQTVNDFMINMLQQVWTYFMGAIGGTDGQPESESYSEESIALHTVVRILNQIVVRVKLTDLSEDAGWNVVNTAMTISHQALFMSTKNAMLSESSVALFLATLRVLCNEHFQSDNSDKIDQLARRLV